MRNYANYTNKLISLTSEVQEATDATTFFLSTVKQDISEIVAKLTKAYSDRVAEFEQPQVVDPESLSDFPNVSDAIAEERYDAWDAYASAIDEYGEDTRTLYSLIQKLQKAMDFIGVVE